jgi:hypothetical protein
MLARTIETWISQTNIKLLSKMSEFDEIARNKLGEAQKVMRKYYDTRTKTSIFKVGDLMHFKNPKVAGPGKKFHPLGWPRGRHKNSCTLAGGSLFISPRREHQDLSP